MIHSRLAPAHRLAVTLALLAPTVGWSQEPAPTETDSIEAINADFNRKYRALERERLEQLAALAGRSDPKEAAPIYETYFRDALGAGLYQEAEPVAERILSQQPPTAVVRYLAEVINIMAEADRGDFEKSLESLLRAIEAGKEADEAELARVALPVAARLSLLDAYYQRLVQAGAYEIARKAFGTVKESAQEGNEPAILDYLSNRIQQLDMIGRPAPSFQGKDVDGRLVRLEDFEGKPILLVFWATWYRPNAEQVAWMKEAYNEYRQKGLQIVGVNLDALASGSQPVEQVIPEVRRYVLDYNISWPNLINSPGEGDIAQAYAVSEIPANALIDSEGRISALDVNQANFVEEVEKVLGEPK
ncbi:peroxiredoxin family protein [Tautonia rosea]|uniref:peroxiredoxin family protein n=1 Tax=Tautonia rosea TaxID=2728037 RepID=UPI001473CA4E|nr:TlpA disulfide reductase family protein [Tautonia rosea]